MVKDSAIDHQKEFIMQIGDYQSLEKIAEEQDCKVWGFCCKVFQKIYFSTRIAS
ncbi:hypothetical protein LLT3_03255 [Lactococcus cremoris subsp. cremoris TIFN3]|uniref:Uncharacterized protein n=1 Tax=Lactococcus cremoris subsp. cremoris TIFN3 TaxID=1234873 RepID=T0WSQ7_LACLC|nr:hypothetical protein LLT3_03255 [Lactococcus cremoris subsp. cremoris TIFN3]